MRRVYLEQEGIGALHDSGKLAVCTGQRTEQGQRDRESGRGEEGWRNIWQDASDRKNLFVIPSSELGIEMFPLDFRRLTLSQPQGASRCGPWSSCIGRALLSLRRFLIC